MRSRESWTTPVRSRGRSIFGARGGAAIASSLVALFVAASAPADVVVPEIEVLSYTTTLQGATNETGSLVGDENPFIVDLAAEQDIPPAGTSSVARSGSIELLFRLAEATDIEIRGDLARYTGGLGSSSVELRLSDVTDPESPVDLISFTNSDVPDQCSVIPCAVPVDIDETLAPGDYVLFASVGATGINVFYPQLGRFLMGGGLAYVDVSMERFFVPEPADPLAAACALATVAGLARRRSRQVRCSERGAG
jgi:hypothetical protein